MKTWRERIAEARTRGGFTKDDTAAASGIWTCAIGEVMGDRWEIFVTTPLHGEEYAPGWTIGVHQSAAFTGAVLSGDVDTAEKYLNAIEDRALQLKREQS